MDEEMEKEPTTMSSEELDPGVEMPKKGEEAGEEAVQLSLTGTVLGG